MTFPWMRIFRIRAGFRTWPLHQVLAAMALVAALGSTGKADPWSTVEAAAAPGRILGNTWQAGLVPNRGQVAPDVLFQASTVEGDLFFTSGGLAFARPGLSIQIHFQGSDPAVEVVGQERLAGVSHYLVGEDPAGWVTDLPRYAGIIYRGLYKGVDLEFTDAGINQRGRPSLKGTYRLAPGADPSQIRWRYIGGRASLDSQGVLRISAGGPAAEGGRERVALTESAPVAWQESAGRRVPVEVAFQKRPDGSFGFALGEYDPNRPLIIDPTLDFSTPLGGTSFDEGLAIAVSTARNAYLVGSTLSMDFPGALSLRPEQDGSRNVFVAKLTRDGSGLEYSAYIGGSGDDIGRAIAVDAAGDIYLTGSTTSSDFPATQLPQKPAESGMDVFIVKLSVSGGAIRYGRVIGGSGQDVGLGIAVNTIGEAFVAGSTDSPDFPAGNSVQLTLTGEEPDGFAFKLNSAGNQLVYSTYLGGTFEDVIQDIDVDRRGNVYLTGYTASDDFPVSNGFLEELQSFQDAFLTRLDSAGGLSYSTYLGVGEIGVGHDVFVQQDGSAYVAGSVERLGDPQGSPEEPSSNEGSDAFALRMDATGKAREFLTFLGGSGEEEGYAIAVDDNGNIYVAGLTESPDLPIDGSLQAGYGGNTDAYLAQLDPSGNLVTYNYMGGLAFDSAHALAVDRQGNAVVVGVTFSADFPVASPLQSSYGGEGDAFVLRIGQVEFVPTPLPPPPPPPTPVPPTPTPVPTMVDQLIQSDQFLYAILGLIGLTILLMLFEALWARRR